MAGKWTWTLPCLTVKGGACRFFQFPSQEPWSPRRRSGVAVGVGTASERAAGSVCSLGAEGRTPCHSACVRRSPASCPTWRAHTHTCTAKQISLQSGLPSPVYP